MLQRRTYAKGEVIVRHGDPASELYIIARNIESCARLCWEPYMHNPKLARRLHRIAAPTLVVYGEEDIICPPRHSHEIAALIPNATLVGVPAQAHQPFQEDPAAFNELVLGFWS